MRFKRLPLSTGRRILSTMERDCFIDCSPCNCYKYCVMLAQEEQFELFTCLEPSRGDRKGERDANALSSCCSILAKVHRAPTILVSFPVLHPEVLRGKA